MLAIDSATVSDSVAAVAVPDSPRSGVRVRIEIIDYAVVLVRAWSPLTAGFGRGTRPEACAGWLAGIALAAVDRFVIEVATLARGMSTWNISDKSAQTTRDGRDRETKSDRSVDVINASSLAPSSVHVLA